MQGYSQHTGEIALGTVCVSKLNSLLMPIQNLNNLPIGQLAKRSARDFHGPLLIDSSQAHCLRDQKGTAPASGQRIDRRPEGTRARLRSSVTAEDRCARLLWAGAGPLLLGPLANLRVRAAIESVLGRSARNAYGSDLIRQWASPGMDTVDAGIPLTSALLVLTLPCFQPRSDYSRVSGSRTGGAAGALAARCWFSRSTVLAIRASRSGEVSKKWRTRLKNFC